MGSLRALTRDTAAAILHALGLTDLSRRHAGNLLVVTFHRVLPGDLRDQYPFPGLAVTPEELSWFLEFLEEHAHPTPLASAFTTWQTTPSPHAPTIAITFDDAQWDNYEYAHPVLERHGVSATFYAPTDYVGTTQALWHDRLGFAIGHLLRRDEEHMLREVLAEHGVQPPQAKLNGEALAQAAKALPPERRFALVDALERQAGGSSCPEWNRLMTWDELSTLAAGGHEIGSHGLSHELLPQCPNELIEKEVTDSKSRIEERLGHDVLSFCYPNGDVDDRTENAAREAGYRAAVTTQWGANSVPANPWRLRRCDINMAHFVDRRGILSGSRTALRLSGLQPGL